MIVTLKSWLANWCRHKQTFFSVVSVVHNWCFIVGFIVFIFIFLEFAVKQMSIYTPPVFPVLCLSPLHSISSHAWTPWRFWSIYSLFCCPGNLRHMPYSIASVVSCRKTASVWPYAEVNSSTLIAIYVCMWPFVIRRNCTTSWWKLHWRSSRKSTRSLSVQLPVSRMLFCNLRLTFSLTVKYRSSHHEICRW